MTRQTLPPPLWPEGAPTPPTPRGAASSPLTPLLARFQRLAAAVATHIRPHLPANRAKVRHLVAMGFPHFEAVWAAKVVRGDVRMCAHFLVAHLEGGGGERMAGCEWCEGRGAAPSPTATAAAAQAKAEEAGGGTAHARSLSLPTAFRGGLDLAREREIDAHSQAERIASSWRRRPRVRQRARFAIDDEEEGPVATRHKHTRSEGAVLPPAAASAPLAPAPASATAAPPRTDSTDSIDAIGATAGADDTVASADGWRTVPGRKRYPWGLEL